MPPVSWYSFSPASPTPAVRWGRSVWTGGGSTCRRRSWSGPLKSELTSLVREVWELVAGEQGELRREEAFLLLVGRLLERCGGCPRPPEEVRPEVRAVCDYLEAHCDRRITLEQLSTLAGLSKYHLLRCFTRQKGITPYRYLETVRVNRARALLEQGATPLDAALRAGFADQSHFNHFFKILTGLTPSQYRAVFAAERGEP